ncbi:MAG: hypothetical protein AB7D37_14785 [Desulfovibrio sp.]
MKVVISVEHPAWAHQFRVLVEQLRALGHETLILAIDKDSSYALLDAFGMNYVPIASTTGTTLAHKAWLFLLTTWRMYRASRRFRPDVFLGRASPMLAVCAFLLGRPHVLFEDTEHSRFSLAVCRLFSTRIVTPCAFARDLGPKQLRRPIYKELFSLSPSVFHPDPTAVREQGLAPDRPFVLVRFVSWTASHDFGLSGQSLEEQAAFVARLAQTAQVVVSCEGPMPEPLRPFAYRLPVERMHHLLAHATLYVGEGATMASEAAVLGVHAVYLNPLDAGCLGEQERRYGLVRSFGGKDRYAHGLAAALELLSDRDLVAKGHEKGRRLLAECENPNALFLELALAANRPA